MTHKMAINLWTILITMNDPIFDYFVKSLFFVNGA
jgi:hypothetical protein